MTTDELLLVHRIVRVGLTLYVLALLVGVMMGFVIGYIVQRLVGG